MARINIEDRLYRDPRFMRLIGLFGGDYFRAVGAYAIMVSLAQEFYLDDQGIIPGDRWKSSHLPEEIVDVGFVERVDGGFRFIDQETQFSWLRQKSFAGKSGRKKQLGAAHRAPTCDGGRGPLSLSLSLSPAQNKKTTLSSDDESSKGESKDQKRHRCSNYMEHPIVMLWNEMPEPFLRVTVMDDDRRRVIRARWAKKPDYAYWQETFYKVASNGFLSGNNDRQWIADFDFVLRPKTLRKLDEGGYSGGHTQQKTKFFSLTEDLLAESKK